MLSAFAAGNYRFIPAVFQYSSGAAADEGFEIERVRFGERLQVKRDVASELHAARVPHLILQPLVENAIKHGVSKRLSGGEIRVAGMRLDGALLLTVYNDGPWVPEGSNSGVGLGNLRTRLV